MLAKGSFCPVRYAFLKIHGMPYGPYLKTPSMQTMPKMETLTIKSCRPAVLPTADDRRPMTDCFVSPTQVHERQEVRELSCRSPSWLSNAVSSCL